MGPPVTQSQHTRAARVRRSRSVVRRAAALLAPLGLGLLLAAPAADALPAPGSLSQLAAPDNCVGELFESHSEGHACGTLVPFGLHVTFQIVVSPDGKNAYSVGVFSEPGSEPEQRGAVIEYSRNPATGALAVIGCLTATSGECASENA